MTQRTALLAVLAVSLAAVVGLSISLFGGVGTSTNQTTTAVAQQEFWGIAQGITRMDDQDLETMANTGIGTDRFLLDWAAVQPDPDGSFDWPDRDVGRLASHGIRLVPYLWGSPSWIADEPGQPPIDSAEHEAAWQSFLKEAVDRYGPGGSYWSQEYRKRFGPNAKPLPMQSWQIWNEPNLEKFFTPGKNLDESAQKYARLVEISHDAIKGEDPQARIVLAGLPGYGDVTAWDFLDAFYRVPGIESQFDAAALHPYAPNVTELKLQVDKLRETMTKRGGESTPLWFSEIGWGSGPPDRFRLNKGLPGQAQLLTAAFRLIEDNKTEWNVQRVFWFDWRDPKKISKLAGTCSFCITAGLLTYDRIPKPAFAAFKGFVAGP